MPRPSVSPLPPDARAKSAERIGAVAIDIAGLRAIAHKAHHNVSGEHFLVLHPYFGELYDLAHEHVDALSEHCSIVLGYPAKSDHVDIGKNAAADPLPDDATCEQICAAILKTGRDVLVVLASAKKEVLAIGDDDGQQLLLDASMALSKKLGFLAQQCEGEEDETPSEKQPRDLGRG